MKRYSDSNPPNRNPHHEEPPAPNLDDVPAWLDEPDDVFRPPTVLPDHDEEHPAPANKPGPTGPRRLDGPPLLLHAASKAWWVLTPDGYVRAPGDAPMLHAHLWQYHREIALGAYVEVPGDPPKRRRMNPGELWQRFGASVDRVIYSYTIEGSRFDPDPADPKRGTLYLKAGRSLAIRAVHHPEVEAWLNLLGGNMAPKLLDWLATCHLLDRPTAALFVYGPPSAGKGLLAAGIAAMFGGERVTLEGATSRFNDSLLKSPFVHLDEGTGGARTASAKLRELIGESTHEIEEKYQPRSTLKGCVRVVVTTNNPDALKIAEELTAEDEAAIGVRLLLIDVPAEGVGCPAADYLADRGGRTFTAEGGDRKVPDGETEPGALCEHIRWLLVNRSVPRGSRFLVEGDPNAWRLRAGERGGVALKILLILAELACGHRGDSQEPGFTVVLKRGDGEALVSPSGLERSWKNLSEAKCPDMKTLAGHLRNLSIDNKPVQVRVGGRRDRGYRIRAKSVIEAAERYGVGDGEQIKRWFEGDSDDPTAPPAGGVW